MSASAFIRRRCSCGLQVEEVIIRAMMAFELERAKASQQRDLFEAALERATSESEKAHLAARLAETQQRLTHIELEDSSSTDTSTLLAWGAIIMARMSVGVHAVYENIIVCGGVEAMAVALRKCRMHDKPVVLQAIQHMIASAPRLESMRAVLGPTLVVMKAHPLNKLVQVEGLGVVLAFAHDPWSHPAIESHLATVIQAMGHHEHDSFVQECGLDVVFHIVDATEEREGAGAAESRCSKQERLLACGLCLLSSHPSMLEQIRQASWNRGPVGCGQRRGRRGSCSRPALVLGAAAHANEGLAQLVAPRARGA